MNGRICARDGGGGRYLISLGLSSLAGFKDG